MRHTLASFKQTASWVQFLNLDSSDSRWLLLLNEALDRLMNAGLWVGTYQRYNVCVCSACITWPRQFETIEAVEVCNRPFTIRNQWFEFLENGPGRARIKSCSSYNLFDRGRGYVMFNDLKVASRIRLYPQFASDVGKVVNLRGYDNSGNWVLTANGATVGENLTIASPYVDSATTWMPQVFREVIKDRTAGYVRAFSWDATLPAPPASPSASDTPLTPMASWEPSETLPNYRRSFLPFLSPVASNCASATCTSQSVMVMAKIAHVPIESDLDFIPLTCAPAIKMAMLAVLKEERGDMAGSQAAMFGTFDAVRRRYVNGAIPLLEDELNVFQGEGTVVPVRVESIKTGTAYVNNLI